MTASCLTNLTQAGGCGCKVDPSVLKRILAISEKSKCPDKRLLLGFETNEDCAVYEDSDDSYLLFTTDFFTPVVDNPYEFGWIAAANALSDIYSMGGHPILANALLGFPADMLSIEEVKKIVQGGNEAIAKSRCLLAGGHTISNPQPFYGFSVIGRVQKEHLKTNLGAKEGDALILTKPLGVGVFTNAMKMGLLDSATKKRIHPMMMEINSVGATLAKLPGVHALTDVTGFGLLGHASEMIDASMHLTLFYNHIPIYKGIEELAQATLSPKSGSMKNLKALENKIAFSINLSEVKRALLCDPQSNGGLLIALDPKCKSEVLSLLQKELNREVHEIGIFSKRKSNQNEIEVRERS